MTPDVPPADDCVLRDVLEKRASISPERLFIAVDHGQGASETWTYRETRDKTRDLAGRLATLGVEYGDRVLVWSSDGVRSLQCWFAINWLGAVYVPINIGYRGAILERLITQSGAGLILIDGELVPLLPDVQNLAIAVLTRAEPQAAAERGALRLEDVTAVDKLPRPYLQAWDVQAVIFTSGTTGPSKGVLGTYCQLRSVVEEPYDFLDGDDRYLCNLPLFHVGGMLPVYAMLVRGGTVVMSRSFRASTFWDTIRRTQATACTMLSGMATLLVKQEPSPADRKHPLRKALVIPLPARSQDMAERFGFSVSTIYHMTEICAPLFALANPVTAAACGTPRQGTAIRLADAHDRPVPPGEVGELLVRVDRPWAMSLGYLDNPAATAAAWRNGWFHTGDAFRIDEDGQYIFVDRLKDVIRRRGENISSFEVEREVCQHPAVLDAAALAVADPNGEDQVMVAVEIRPGASLSLPDLLHFLTPRMPRFMLPGHLRLVDAFPRTPSGKVQKAQLRADLARRGDWPEAARKAVTTSDMGDRPAPIEKGKRP